MPSGEGEAGEEMAAEGRRVGSEIKPKLVAHVADSSGAGGSLYLRQDISCLGSWGFNG
jgi:hypothetical protein